MAKVAKTLIALRLKREAVAVIKFWAERDKDSQAGIVEAALKLYDEHRTEPEYVLAGKPETVLRGHDEHSAWSVMAQKVEERGFTIQCRHCGERAQGATKFATVCFECKGSGHSNAPAECPVCTAGQGI